MHVKDCTSVPDCFFFVNVLLGRLLSISYSVHAHTAILHALFDEHDSIIHISRSAIYLQVTIDTSSPPVMQFVYR